MFAVDRTKVFPKRAARWLHSNEIGQSHLHKNHVVGNERAQRLVERAFGLGEQKIAAPEGDGVALHWLPGELACAGKLGSEQNNATEGADEPHQQN
ncbi:MAG: hypothetical protein QOH39_519 [Verrucomicrobiota bacterium]